MDRLAIAARHLLDPGLKSSQISVVGDGAAQWVPVLVKPGLLQQRHITRFNNPRPKLREFRQQLLSLRSTRRCLTHNCLTRRLELSGPSRVEFCSLALTLDA